MGAQRTRIGGPAGYTRRRALAATGTGGAGVTALAALATAAAVDPTLQPDVIVFPGQVDQFREKALTLYAGGDLPDAQWIHPSITALLGSRKLARPLDELARRDRSTPLTDFYPGVLDYFRWRGTAYGLPWYSPGYVFVFNRALFERLGAQPA